MGIDLLDIAFRIEKVFGTGTKSEWGELIVEASNRESEDIVALRRSHPRPWKLKNRLTAGAISDAVCRRLRENGKEMDREVVWQKVRKILADVLGLDEAEIRPESDLFADLGCG